ncbi:bifunctional lysylphosphatidylglycerol flippase/synthetase MprF [Bifidobacterium favimelis]|uniref:DUF2156 domain-containing protein n=1 Tax=Bifidobacterium favimelis TaxID=3122979 RepID=A0ABU8ZMV6_9BIFI
MLEKSPRAALMDDLKAWLRQHMLSLAFTAALVVVNLVSWFFIWILRVPKTAHMGMYLSDLISVPHPAVVGTRRPSIAFQFARLLVTLFVTPTFFQLIVDAALVMVILSIAETRLGRRKMVWSCLVSSVGGAALGLAICAGINAMQNHWSWFVHIPMSLNPVILVIGALMASISYSDFLWRRRISLVGYTALILLVLYTGNPGNYCALAAALIGHAMGRIWHGPVRDRPQGGQTGSYETRHLLSAIACVMALGPMITALSRVRAGFFTPLGMFMGTGRAAASDLSSCLRSNTKASCYAAYGLVKVNTAETMLTLLMPTLVLLLLAWGIYHGRRVAAMTSVVLHGLTVVLSFLYFIIFPITIGDGLGRAVRHGAIPSLLVTALPPLIFAVVLLRYLYCFPIRTFRSRLAWGSVILILAFLVTATAYVGFTVVSPGSFRPRPTISQAIGELPDLYLPNGIASRFRPRYLPRTLTGTIVSEGVGFVFWLVLLIVLLSWMRASVIQNESERLRAQAIVEKGGESMSFMTTWQGNTYWFSSSGRSAIAYRVLHGIALTTTGPFGDPGEYMQDLDDFTAYCVEHSWSPVFYSVHKPQRDRLADEGWATLKVGTEMVVDPNLWQTRGKKWQDIRTAINKAKRDKITDVLTTFNDAPWSVQSQIVDISEQWAELKALPEMKFTLGGLDELRDHRMAILYAIDDGGQVLGVTSWMPTYRQGKVIGWTLDFMRHRTDSPNGIMEFLIARMAERLRDDGSVEFMSLSAAPLAGMDPSEGEDEGVGYHRSQGTEFLQHALTLVADILEPAYGFRSLFFFKRKFQPSEHPVYICYPNPAALVQIGLAVVEAYLPGFKASQALDVLKTLRPAKSSERADLAESTDGPAEARAEGHEPADGKGAGEKTAGGRTDSRRTGKDAGKTPGPDGRADRHPGDEDTRSENPDTHPENQDMRDGQAGEEPA